MKNIKLMLTLMLILLFIKVHVHAQYIPGKINDISLSSSHNRGTASQSNTNNNVESNKTELLKTPTMQLTENGLRDANDKEKSFVVINCNGKTAMELYRNAVKYINKIYKNPDEVIKGKMEGEYLKFNRSQSKFVKYNYDYYSIETHYQTELNFKDGKVKYEIIEFQMYQYTARPTYSQYQSNPNAYNLKDPTIPFLIVRNNKYDGVFCSNGEVCMSEVKQKIEDWFNNEIKLLTNALNEGGNSGSNNW